MSKGGRWTEAVQNRDLNGNPDNRWITVRRGCVYMGSVHEFDIQMAEVLDGIHPLPAAMDQMQMAAEIYEDALRLIPDLSSARVCIYLVED